MRVCDGGRRRQPERRRHRRRVERRAEQPARVQASGVSAEAEEAAATSLSAEAIGDRGAEEEIARASWRRGLQNRCARPNCAPLDLTIAYARGMAATSATDDALAIAGRRRRRRGPPPLQAQLGIATRRAPARAAAAPPARVGARDAHLRARPQFRARRRADDGQGELARRPRAGRLDPRARRCGGRRSARGDSRRGRRRLRPAGARGAALAARRAGAASRRPILSSTRSSCSARMWCATPRKFTSRGSTRWRAAWRRSRR